MQQNPPFSVLEAPENPACLTYPHRLSSYPGDPWWFPLSTEARAQLDQKEFLDFMFRTTGREYDTLGAVFSIDLGHDAREDFTKLFCSELYAGALKAAGVLDANVNASEVTPADCVRLPIFGERYTHVLGVETREPIWLTRPRRSSARSASDAMVRSARMHGTTSSGRSIKPLRY